MSEKKKNAEARELERLMDDLVSLRDELTVRAADGGGKVPARVQDLGKGRAKHRFTHFLDDAYQPVLHYRYCHWIYRGHCSTILGPAASPAASLLCVEPTLSHP